AILWSSSLTAMVAGSTSSCPSAEPSIRQNPSRVGGTDQRAGSASSTSSAPSAAHHSGKCEPHALNMVAAATTQPAHITPVVGLPRNPPQLDDVDAIRPITTLAELTINDCCQDLC